MRAPLPGGFYGRSLRPVLDDAEGSLPSRPVYAESLAGYYRLGTAPIYSVTTETRQLIRNAKDTIVPIEAGAEVGATPNGAPAADSVPDSVPLDAVLDELVVGRPLARPEPLTLEQEKRLALGGFLAGPAQPTETTTAPALGDKGVFDAHRRAARLVGEDKIAAAIQELQKVAKAHPELGAVHWEVGELLLRTGRLDEAVAALERAEQGVARQPRGGAGLERRAAARGQVGSGEDLRGRGHRAGGARDGRGSAGGARERGARGAGPA